MKRITNFGYKTVGEQLNFLQGHLETEEILLFQYYDCGKDNTYDIDVRNEYFEIYGDDDITSAVINRNGSLEKY